MPFAKVTTNYIAFANMTLSVTASHTITNTPQQIPLGFAIYWGGQVFSLMGSSLTQFAIIWWIAITYQSTYILGLAYLFGLGSQVLVLPIVGIISDFEDRKRVLLLADFAQASVTILLIGSIVYGFLDLVLLLLLLALRGFFQSIHTNTNQSIIPQIVPKNLYSRLNALNLFSVGISEFLGPLLGAALVEILGGENIDKILWIDVITFVVAVITLFKLTIPKLDKQKTASLTFRKNLTFGFSYIKRRRILILLMSLTPVVNFTLAPVQVLIPVYVLDSAYYNAGATQLAFAFGLVWIGYIVSSIITSMIPITGKFALRFVLATLLWTAGVSIVLISIILNSLILLYVGQFVSGTAFPLYNVVTTTTWQQLVPNEFLGRVVAVRKIFATSSYPISLFLAGYLAEQINPVLLVGSGIIIYLLYLLLVLVFTSFRNLDRIIQQSSG